jgi:uncharacterized protein YdhG (YjbR/CyaY superfamily)
MRSEKVSGLAGKNYVRFLTLSTCGEMIRPFNSDMAKTNFKSVPEYILSQPVAAQAALRQVRTAIKKAVPEGKEVISYQIPALKRLGKPVLYFAGWKQHYSLYPANDDLVATFKDELAAYKISKGTIRFPLSQPVPVKLIERIAKFRAKQVAAGEKAKATRLRSFQISK